jgi:agmatine deiminase
MGKKIKNVFLLLAFITPACVKHIQAQVNTLENNFYTQANTNRTVAEWEPANGTMVAWPLALPYKLVVELAKDNHLYTLVENDTIKAEAQKWYDQWGIEASHNTFVYLPRGIDFWWIRDWGPSAIFMPDGKMKLADANCRYVPPRAKWGCTDALYSLFSDKQHETLESEIDDNTIVPLGKGLNLEVLNLPFINTGGNFMTDGLGTAFSTCIMVSENKFHQVPEAQYFKLNQDLQGIKNYHIISNFEKMGIQHIDCFMKLLDEERMLVAEPPVNHELHAVYEKIIENELKKLKTVYGRPYEILRLKTDRYDGDKLAAYTNSIIVNKTIYVPLFQIKADSIALQTWRNAMPGYVVKGFEFALKDEPFLSEGIKEQYSSGYGWKSGDALHCRTRAVWDPEMLFISTKRIEKVVDSKHKNIVYTTIVDYSKKGLVESKAQLFWRVMGETSWRSAVLNPTENPSHFFYEIPYHEKGATVEYFIAAESKSGRKETQPRSAPAGMYQFRIK